MAHRPSAWTIALVEATAEPEAGRVAKTPLTCSRRSTMGSPRGSPQMTWTYIVILVAVLLTTGCTSSRSPLQQFEEDFEIVPDYENVIHVYRVQDKIYRAVWCEPIKEENVQICHRWLFFGKPDERRVLNNVCPISRDIIEPFCRDAKIKYGEPR